MKHMVCEHGMQWGCCTYLGCLEKCVLQMLETYKQESQLETYKQESEEGVHQLLEAADKMGSGARTPVKASAETPIHEHMPIHELLVALQMLADGVVTHTPDPVSPAP